MPESSDSLSDSARPDMDALLNVLLPQAQELVRQHGEFYPFGAAISVEGQTALCAGFDGVEHPESQDVIDLLLAGLRRDAEAGRIRAAAICLDVRVSPPGHSEKSDAICVRIEHHSGEAAAVYLPYGRGFLGKTKFGQLYAARGEREVFRPAPGGAAT